MAAEDLCTLANVREFLQKPAADTNQDAVIQSLITRASNAIMRYTEREFAPAATATRKFEWDRREGEVLSLAPYDLRTVTTLKIDSDQTTPITLTTDEYRLGPKPNRDGVYNRVRLRPYSIAQSSWRFPAHSEVEINGAWGFASVPSEIVHWTIVTTAIWLRRDVAAFSSTLNLEEDRVERPEALPSAVTRGLERWKRLG